MVGVEVPVPSTLIISVTEPYTDGPGLVEVTEGQHRAMVTVSSGDQLLSVFYVHESTVLTRGSPNCKCLLFPRVPLPLTHKIFPSLSASCVPKPTAPYMVPQLLSVSSFMRSLPPHKGFPNFPKGYLVLTIQGEPMTGYSSSGRASALSGTLALVYVALMSGLGPLRPP